MNINEVTAASRFLELAKSDFSHKQPGILSEKEDLVAKKLLELFHELLSDICFEEDEELEELPSEGLSSQVSVYNDDGEEIAPDHKENCTIERKAQILKLIEKHPNWSIRTIQLHGGREFKYSQYKKRWEQQVKAGGTVFEKYRHIDSYTYECFVEARKELICVKESTIRLWALQASQHFRDHTFSFKASPRWINSFKNKHGISSRKVTKLVSKREILSMDAILNSAKQFQSEFKAASQSYLPHLVLNTDQVGFSYELTGNRTLSHKGEKLTLGLAKSPQNLATHSYTAQYVITKAGTIVGDVFLCLQEATGRLGSNVEKNLFPAPNVTLTCTTSGKLTTSSFEYFLDRIILKNVKESFLFLVDSWSGQTNASSYQTRFGTNGNPACNLKIIPKKCTSLVQPLDTTFHRQLKYFAKLIYSEALLQSKNNTNPADEITTRNNIIRTQSLLHNQFSAPIFMPLIKYAWFSSGLSDDKPQFDSVKEACFTFESTEIICTACSGPRFVKCAHCRKILCFSCFYYDYHFHF